MIALLSKGELIPVELIAEFKSNGKAAFDRETLSSLVAKLESFDYDDVMTTLRGIASGKTDE